MLQFSRAGVRWRGDRLSDYHIYCLDDRNVIVRRHHHLADDDESALEAARKFCGDYGIEIWVGTRRVARLGKDGEAIDLTNAAA